MLFNIHYVRINTLIIILFLLTDVKVNYAMFSVLTVLAVLGVLVFFLIVPVTRPATGYRQLDSG
jgi:hypothetical protein